MNELVALAVAVILIQKESFMSENQASNLPRPEVGTKLLFENERIRVWDLSLAPGEWLETHVHKTDFCFIVAHGGHLEHSDPNDPISAHQVNYETDQVMFIPVEDEAGVVHQRLTNIGTEAYQNYVIELKDGQGLGADNGD